MEEVCRQIRQRKAAGQSTLRIAVNISALQLKQEDFLDTLLKLLSTYQVAAGDIELELTESVLMEDVESHIQLLGQLRQHGFTLAVDDFGTGYSSLAYLRRFPISRLKIDKSFVQEITSAEDDAAVIAASTIALGRSMNLEVVAEGIETAKQAEFLLSMGCYFGQGYYYSPPRLLRDLHV